MISTPILPPSPTFTPEPTRTPEPTSTPVPPEVHAVQLLNRGWQIPISDVYTEWNSFAGVDILIEHEKDVKLAGSILVATNDLLEYITGDPYNTSRITGSMEIPVNARPIQEAVAISAAPSQDPHNPRVKVTYTAPQFRLGLVNPEMNIMGSSRYTNRAYSVSYAREGSREREIIDQIYREAMLLKAIYDACSASPALNPMTMDLSRKANFSVQDLLNRNNLGLVPFEAVPSGPVTFDYGSCGSAARAEREHRIQEFANSLPHVRKITIQLGPGWQLQLR